jgi:acylphosphatase
MNDHEPTTEDRPTAAARRSVHGTVAGVVQGVNFRRSMQREAVEGDLVGWVRNLADGRVEFVAQGRPEDLERLLAWARRGPSGARVTGLDVADRPLDDGLAGFPVLPTIR